MNANENIILQGLQLGLDRLALEIAKQREEAQARGRFDGLPEWLDLEQAITLKRGLCTGKKRAENGKNRSADEPCEGGASIIIYRQKPFLQPCCGRNYSLIGGRRCWRRDDVIFWLSITDENLSAYSAKWKVKIPPLYAKRSA